MQVSHGLCPPPCEPPSPPARGRGDTHTPARGGDGLPDFSSRAHESGFPTRLAGFSRPRNAARTRADPWDPAVRAQSPLPGSPPERSGGAPGLLTLRLNVSARPAGKTKPKHQGVEC